MADRIEKDSMGELNVPEKAYYGVHTQRSVHNFQISSLKWNPRILKAIAQLKKACAKANYDLELLDEKKAKAISKACSEIIKGKLSDQFPLDIFQAGSGTSTNMNVNEVIANRAAQILGGKRGERSLVHPNDDVNKGQSTNNVIPSAIRVACVQACDLLEQELISLKESLKLKSEEFSSVLKSARTHLQDAVPITLGQEFNAYATAMGKHVHRVRETKLYLRVLGIGGNAVGTGLNTYPEFRERIIVHLRSDTKKEFQVTEDGIESTQFLTDIAGLSGILKLIAIDLNKIANDLRLMSSGPKTGLKEIDLPAVEPGSSIMPGKINPSIAEAVNMACHHVIGNDSSITMSCASGNLDLNTHMPIIGHSVIESLEILAHTIQTFSEKCISGITVNNDNCQYYVEHSMALATALNPHMGYDKAAAIVKESLKTGKTIKELVLKKKLLSKKELDKILDPSTLTSPNLKRKK